MRVLYPIILLLILSSELQAQRFNRDSLLHHILPNDIKLQYAGNIGMFAVGVGYVTPNQKWKADLLYGIVPSDYADDPIHSLTVKGKYTPINRQYGNGVHVNWFHTGMLFNYSLGNKYFLGLPEYYDKGYYYFPTALNVGVFVGSEIRYKKWGIYYELGTTEKRVINYAKNTRSIDFNEIWNIGVGLVYHLK
ncbi:hypothetical protein [Sphingobacterium suaedae]|uniref:DUF3575 domain-containing protein n=1 Tax=Sphingobacterium suaedae TaxID=1686402 RepID=A0ABW5KIU8_9SPHI